MATRLHTMKDSLRPIGQTHYKFESLGAPPVRILTFDFKYSLMSAEDCTIDHFILAL